MTTRTTRSAFARRVLLATLVCTAAVPSPANASTYALKRKPIVPSGMTVRGAPFGIAGARPPIAIWTSPPTTKTEASRFPRPAEPTSWWSIRRENDEHGQSPSVERLVSVPGAPLGIAGPRGPTANSSALDGEPGGCDVTPTKRSVPANRRHRDRPTIAGYIRNRGRNAHCETVPRNEINAIVVEDTPDVCSPEPTTQVTATAADTVPRDGRSADRTGFGSSSSSSSVAAIVFTLFVATGALCWLVIGRRWLSSTGRRRSSTGLLSF